MPIDESVLKKIRNLFALAGNNPNENEAHAAACKAQELLAKYHLSMSDIKEENSEAKEGEKISARRHGDRILAAIVAKHYRCMTLQYNGHNGKKEVVFVGEKDDPKIAQTIFLYLRKVMRKGCNDHIKNLERETYLSGIPESKKRRVIYYYNNGFNTRLAQVLEGHRRKLSENDGEYGLILVTPQSVTDYMKQFKEGRRCSGLRGSRDALDRLSYAQGWHDGDIIPDAILGGEK